MRTKEFTLPARPSVLGTAHGAIAPTAEITNTTLGRFQQDDLFVCPDLGNSCGMTPYNDLPCCLFWKVRLPLGSSSGLVDCVPLYVTAGGSCTDQAKRGHGR